MAKKKSKKKMPSAPIKPNVGNVKGAGSMNSQKLGGVSFMTKKPGDSVKDYGIIKGLIRIN